MSDSAHAAAPGNGASMAKAAAALSATLGPYVFGWDLRIDELLFSDAGAYAHPGRMSPNSAAGFVCPSLALVCLPWQMPASDSCSRARARLP